MSSEKQIKAFNEVQRVLLIHLVTVELFNEFSIMVTDYVYEQGGDLDRLSDLYDLSEEAHDGEHPILKEKAGQLFKDKTVTNTILGNMIYDLYMVSTHYPDQAFELAQH